MPSNVIDRPFLWAKRKKRFVTQFGILDHCHNAKFMDLYIRWLWLSLELSEDVQINGKAVSGRAIGAVRKGRETKHLVWGVANFLCFNEGVYRDRPSGNDNLPAHRRPTRLPALERYRVLNFDTQ